MSLPSTYSKDILCSRKLFLVLLSLTSVIIIHNVIIIQQLQEREHITNDETLQLQLNSFPEVSSHKLINFNAIRH